MLVVCPHCRVHTRRAKIGCDHCGESLRGIDGRIARTTGALLMGLAVAGVQPAYAGTPVGADSDAIPTEWRDMGFEKACTNVESVNELHPTIEGFIDAGRCYRTWAAEDVGASFELRQERLARARQNLEAARQLQEGNGAAEAVDDLERELTLLEDAVAQLQNEIALDESRPPPIPVYGVPPRPSPGCACEVTQRPADLPIPARLAAMAALLVTLGRRIRRRRGASRR